MISNSTGRVWADLTIKEKPQELVDFAIKEKGSVDILVNNAGVAQHGYIEKFTDEMLDKIMNINVDANIILNMQMLCC